MRASVPSVCLISYPDSFCPPLWTLTHINKQVPVLACSTCSSAVLIAHLSTVVFLPPPFLHSQVKSLSDSGLGRLTALTKLSVPHNTLVELPDLSACT